LNRSEQATVRVALRLPPAVGWKVTVNAQTLSAGAFVRQSFALIVKSPACIPVMVKLVNWTSLTKSSS
jgi:hypothetical protein